MSNTLEGKRKDSLLYNFPKVMSYFSQALDEIGKNEHIFEVGAYRGGASAEFLRLRDMKGGNNQLIIVDPYMVEGLSKFDPPKETMDSMLAKVEPYKNWTFYQQMSDEFFNNVKLSPLIFGDNKIGAALLDGDHTPEGECRDISNTIPCLGEKFLVVVDDIHCGPQYPEGLGIVTDHIYKVFKDCYIRTVDHGLVQQAYIWKGFRPRD